MTDRVNTYTKFNFWVPKNTQAIALRQVEREFSMALMNLANTILKNHQIIAKIKKPWLESISLWLLPRGTSKTRNIGFF